MKSLLSWRRKRKAKRVLARHGICHECFAKLSTQRRGSVGYLFCAACHPELAFRAIAISEIEEAKRVLRAVK